MGKQTQNPGWKKDLMGQIQVLIEKGNARRLTIRKPKGASLLDMSLTTGVVALVIFLLLAPALAAIGILLAWVKGFKLELEAIRTDAETLEQKRQESDD